MSRLCLPLATLVIPVVLIQSAVASPPGTLDADFDSDGKLTTLAGKDYSLVNGLVQQADGKLAVAGVSREQASDDFTVVRYNGDGSLDTSFSGDGKIAIDIDDGDESANAVIQQFDKRLVAAGSRYGDGNDDFAVIRLTSSGALDKSFSADGLATTPIGTYNDGAYALLQQNNEFLVAAGYAESVAFDYDFALVRYKTNGELDAGFDTDGKVVTNFVGKHDVAYSVLEQADGKLVAAGYSHNGNHDDFALARYNANGSLDATFSKDGKVTTDFASGKDRAFAMLRQADGKLVVVGYATVAGNEDFAVARYKPDGSLDGSFSSDGKLTTSVGNRNDRAYGVVQQYDGKLLVGGYTQKADGDFDFVLVRYNADGSLDSDFSDDGKLTTSFGAGIDKAFAMIAQNNGQVVLAGSSDVGGKQKMALARYLFDDDDNDGVLDDADNCPLLKNADQVDHDDDSHGDVCDDDDDNDGVVDSNDAFPLDPKESVDSDRDGIGNNADTDDDGDGVADNIDPFPLDPYLLVRIGGARAGDGLGYSVAVVGDMDRDGFSDFAVGSPFADPLPDGKKQPLSKAGSVEVYSGKTGQVLPNLALVGQAAGDEFGIAVAGGGDVDGDGIGDLVVGAHKAEVADPASGKKLKNAGTAVVYSGASGKALFRINGRATEDRLGATVAIIADADGDGYAEVLAGAPQADAVSAGKKLSNAGAVYAYSGRSGSQLQQWFGEGKGDRFGAALAVADLDRDGKPEAVVGAPDRDGVDGSKRLSDAGGVYVYAVADGSLQFKIVASHAGDRLGFSVAGVADIDHDNYDDLLLGVPLQDVTDPASNKLVKDAGAVAVRSGRDGSLVRQMSAGQPQTGAWFGNAVAALGDVNEDGTADFLVGRYRYDVPIAAGKLSDAGGVAVLSGVDGQTLFAVEGVAKGDFFGFALTGGGDYNGDGLADLLIGGHAVDQTGASGKPAVDAGSVKILSGQALKFGKNCCND